MTARHCLASVYTDWLGSDIFHRPEGEEWPWFEYGDTLQEQLDKMCGLFEVAMGYTVTMKDVLMSYGGSLPSDWTPSDLEEDEWHRLFRKAKDGQENFKCKKAYPAVDSLVGTYDIIVIELDGDPGFKYGWMDVASEDSEPYERTVMIGHPWGCPAMISYGGTGVANDPNGKRTIYNYITGGFSGSPILIPGDESTSGGSVALVAATSVTSSAAKAVKSCFKADHVPCNPTNNGEVCDEPDENNEGYQGPGFTDHEAENGNVQNQGTCIQLYGQGSGIRTHFYFDAINEITRPDMRICALNVPEGEGKVIVSELCQDPPGTNYPDRPTELRANMLFCDENAVDGCPDPYLDDLDVDSLEDLYTQNNTAHQGWHPISYDFKRFDIPPPSVPVVTLDEDRWITNVNCYKGDLLDDNDVLYEGNPPVQVEYCQSKENIDPYYVGSYDDWLNHEVQSATGALDKHAALNGSIEPLTATPLRDVHFYWDTRSEIWWDMNIGKDLEEAWSNNNDTSTERSLSFAVITEYKYQKDNSTTWETSRPYNELDRYFDSDDHRRNITLFDSDSHTKIQTVGQGTMLNVNTPTNERPMGDRLIGNPGRRMVGNLDSSVPVLVNIEEERLSFESCGFDDSTGLGATLAFADPEVGRIVHEVCANHSSDGSYPRTYGSSFEAVGYQRHGDYLVASYGGFNTGEPLSDELLLGTVTVDTRGFPNHVTWQRAVSHQPNAYVPPALQGAVLSSGYLNDSLYLVGGTKENGRPGGLYRFDISSDTWTQMHLDGNVRGVKVKEPAAVRHTNVLYLFGGELRNGRYSNGLYALYLSSGYVERLSIGGINGRKGASLSYSQSTASLYLYGGESISGGVSRQHNDVWRFSLASPENGWKQVSDECVGRNCPGLSGGALLFDRFGEAPFLVSSVAADEQSRARGWKLVDGEWTPDKEQGSHLTAADCDGDSVPENGWGKVCGRGSWWKPVGLKRCDAASFTLYCDRPKAKAISETKTYHESPVRDFAALGELIVAAGHHSVDVIDPDGSDSCWFCCDGPKRIGSIDLSSMVNAVATQGNTIFAATRDGVAVIDATQPEQPMLVMVLPTSESPLDLVVSSEKRLFAADRCGVSEFIIEDPLSPIEQDRLDLFEECNQYDDIGWWCNQNCTFNESWEWDFCQQQVNPVTEYHGIVVVGNGEDLVVVDANNPGEMRLISTVDLGITPEHIRLWGSNLYATGKNGRHVINLSDPQSPWIMSNKLKPPVRHWTEGRILVGDWMVRHLNDFLLLKLISQE